MHESEWKKYEENLALLEKNNLEISTHNHYYNEDGMHIWGFSAEMSQFDYSEDVEYDEDERKEVVQLSGGTVIPAEIEFMQEDKAYGSAYELCDAMSGDMEAVYAALANVGEGIKTEILEELNLDEEEGFESSILYIDDISAEEPQYLKMFLQLFDFVVEGLPARNCRVAVVVMNWEKENNKAKIFLENDWRIRSLDAEAVIAYRKI